MEKITPEQAIQILKEEGLQVNTEQAKQIVDLLYLLAEITVLQYLENENS